MSTAAQNHEELGATHIAAHCALQASVGIPTLPQVPPGPLEVILPASEVSPAHAHAGRRAAGEPVLTAFSHVGAETLDLGLPRESSPLQLRQSQRTFSLQRRSL